MQKLVMLSARVESCITNKSVPCAQSTKLRGGKFGEECRALRRPVKGSGKLVISFERCNAGRLFSRIDMVVVSKLGLMVPMVKFLEVEQVCTSRAQATRTEVTIHVLGSASAMNWTKLSRDTLEANERPIQSATMKR
jgi:hypothetical protein